MREAGVRLARVLAETAKLVRPGTITKDIDDFALESILKEGARPAFLNYKPSGAKKAYPAASCISINEVVVHGIPGDTVIKEGDIVSIDLGLVYKGWYADSAVTVAAGKISKEAEKLISVTREALNLGIKAARPGNTFGDIGFAVESCAKKNGFSVIYSLTGHGIGRKLHEDPWVLNTGKRGEGEKLLSGMVMAIEPMISAGLGEIKQTRSDSYITRDGSLAAHFEHTIAIMENGPEILTVISGDVVL